MDIIEKIISNVEKTTKAVVQKSNDMVELTKIKVALSGDEAKAEGLIREAGELVYAAYKDGTGDPEDVEKVCKQLEQLEEEIVKKKNQLARLRNLKRCGKCGNENDIDAIYCNRCGDKLPEVEVEEVDDAAADEDITKDAVDAGGEE